MKIQSLRKIPQGKLLRDGQDKTATAENSCEAVMLWTRTIRTKQAAAGHNRGQ